MYAQEGSQNDGQALELRPSLTKVYLYAHVCMYVHTIKISLFI